MATINTPLEIKLITDAEEFRKSMKAAQSEVAKFAKATEMSGKKSFLQDKTLERAEKELRRSSKADRKEARKHEEAMLKLLRERTTALRNLNSAGKARTPEAQQLRESITTDASRLADIRRSRQEEEDNEKAPKSRLHKWGKRALAGAAIGAVAFVANRMENAMEDVDELYKSAQAMASVKDFDSANMLEISRIGARQGFNVQDSARMTSSAFRTTGDAAETSTLQKLMRTSGLDEGDALSFMGMQARGGRSGGSSRNEQQRVLASAFASGLKQGRFGEFFQGVADLVQDSQGRTGTTAGGEGYAGILAAMGKMGGAAFQGAGGVNVLKQLEHGFMNPGAGEAGQAYIMRALGFGTPGGQSSYYDALKAQQTGFSGEAGIGNLSKLMSMALDRYGGVQTQTGNMELSNVTGIKLPMVEKLVTMFEQLRGQGAGSDAIGKAIRQFEKDNASQMVAPDERIAEILEKDIMKRLAEQSGYQQNMVESMAKMRPEVDKFKESIDSAIVAMTKVLAPALIDLADTVNSAVYWWSEGKHGRDVSGSQYKELTADDMYNTSTQRAKANTSDVKLPEATIAEMKEIWDKVNKQGLAALSKIERDKYDLAEQANKQRAGQNALPYVSPEERAKLPALKQEIPAPGNMSLARPGELRFNWEPAEVVIKTPDNKEVGKTTLTPIRNNNISYRN